jgi:sterol desaturase/sphingolipid hydroxylase (fatty acid hydroxylase superfamily)
MTERADPGSKPRLKDFTFFGRDYRLDKMTLAELWGAYFLYPAIQVYIVLALASAYASYRWSESLLPVAIAVVTVALVYPLVWYLLHRYVLHGQWLYRSRWTAKVWKRIHFDHHRDPHDLKVLFGALYTTLPTIFVIVTPIGWLIGGPGGAAAALSAGLAVTCFYEFCHCVQHLNYTPRWGFLKRIKRLHLQHHFHDEHANYGITSFVPDKMFGTFADNPKERPKSPTVFNLGYTGEEVRKFPWVARMTPDLDEERAAREGVGRRKPTKV